MDIVKIEARVINDEHSAFWYKATLHGCHFDFVKGGKQDRIIIGQAQVPPNTLLTFRVARGDMDFIIEDFWIVCVDVNQPEQLLGDANNGYIKGRFEVLAYGEGETKASLLRAWWFEWAPVNGGQTHQIAKFLMQQLKKRRKIPMSYPHPLAERENSNIFNPVESWKFEPIKNV